jgi:hypothetical protein
MIKNMIKYKLSKKLNLNLAFSLYLDVRVNLNLHPNENSAISSLHNIISLAVKGVELD